MLPGLREMVVESVRVHMLSSQHVVILREAERERYLPIWIGSWEAQAIAMKLQGIAAERPLTHDLLARHARASSASTCGASSSRTSPTRRTGRASSSTSTGATSEIDARPSDAIALAVRVAAPIFATEAVLDRAGVIPETDEEEQLSVFREFVNSLDVELGSEGGRGARTRRSTTGRCRRRRRARRAPLRRLEGARPAPDVGWASRAGSARRARSAASRSDPEPQAQAPEVAHRAEHDPRVGARRAARGPRMVRHADLDDAAARSPRA